MHEFIIKKKQDGLFDIKAATFSDMEFSEFDIAEEDLEKAKESIRASLRICYDTDSYKTQVNFRNV